MVNKNIHICTEDPIKAIFLAMFMLIAIPLTNALLITEPIIAIVIDFGISIYIAINIICTFFHLEVN